MLIKTHQMTVDQPVVDPMAEGRARVERHLAALFAAQVPARGTLHAAMQDAALAGGKRIRPVLCMLVNRATGGQNEGFALAAGAAVELVHCASLILDDLPCMDDAALRRGRPAVHRAHGEASAILAAIALMNLAYEEIAKAPVDDEKLRARAMKVLTHAIGTAGLVAGQDLDLHEKPHAQTPEELDEINWKKTGVLFVAAAELGAIAGGASEPEIEHVREFARHLGLAFQTRDDILDQIGSSDETGKDTHQDDDSTTLVRLLGLSVAEGDCRRHLDEASAALTRSGLCPTELAELVCRVFQLQSQQRV